MRTVSEGFGFLKSSDKSLDRKKIIVVKNNKNTDAIRSSTNSSFFKGVRSTAISS
jgi:hypothetical protein